MMVTMFVFFIESKYNNSSDLFSNYLCGELRKNWLFFFRKLGALRAEQHDLAQRCCS
jgi:hypothetical protein